MKSLTDLKLQMQDLQELNLTQLDEKLIELRKQQFHQRMQKAAGALDKTHVVRIVRRAIARIKTLKTEKAKQYANN